MISYLRLVGVWSEWIWDASIQLAIFVTLVGVASWLLRNRSAQLRHFLWLLVLLKAVAPPSLGAPWSPANWIGEPSVAIQFVAVGGSNPSTSGVSDPAAVPPVTALWPAQTLVVFWIWAFGASALMLAVVIHYLRTQRTLAHAEEVDEGPARVLLEEAALRLRVATPPDLLVTDQLTSPFVIGVLKPRIVIPRSLSQNENTDVLRAVLTHELIHCRRHDVLIGWLQTLVQSVYWFHPFVWWANQKLRHERECACDEAVLSRGRHDPQKYSDSLIHTLTASRGRSLALGSLTGVFERGSKLQNRLEGVMSYELEPRRFGWTSGLILVLFAGLFLPMAPWEAPHATAGNNGATASFPKVVKTTPASGATDVDPSLEWVTVTFDREMGKGMSWTGGPPHFPPVDKSRKPRWKDKRTCELPVKLRKASYYRFGINSKSYLNFRDAAGNPALPTVVRFTTKGAGERLKARLEAPKIASMNPANGAESVDPTLREIRVTFDKSMASGFSWTGGGDDFPKIPGGQKPRWTKDGRTCILPVELKPNWTYALGLNSPSHNNFQSKWDVPLEPVRYSFSTGQ